MEAISNEDIHVPARFWLDPQETDRDVVAQAMRLCKLPSAVAAELNEHWQSWVPGRPVVVHRRGAARVEPGTWSCVAGSARSGNWIVEGVGSAGALFSCPQGAGRRWAAGAEWDRLTEETPLRLEGLARVAHHLRPLPAS